VISSPKSLAPVALALGIFACKSEPKMDQPFVDRSDGILPTLHAPRVDDAAISIDGKLEEPAWQSAPKSGLFVNPGDGHPNPKSNVNAHVRLLFSDKRLFAAFVVYDKSPSSPFSRSDVDPHVWGRASGVELMIQPGDMGDNRDYYEVQVDSAGALWDTFFDDYNRPITGTSEETKRFGHQEWVSDCERAIEIDGSQGRYLIELSIPWSKLASKRTESPPAAGKTWRMNFYSFRDGQRDSLAWSPILGQGNFHKSARFGRVVFGN
jgi:hypothetical protein